MTQREPPEPGPAAGQIKDEVRSLALVVGARLKQWLVRLWMLRGGGFYGLGFVLFFVAAELNSLFGDLLESEGPVDFLSSLLLESLLKFISEMPFNFLWALLWPLQFLSWTGEWGLLVLLLAFLAFQRWLKPWLTERFLGEP